jgi:peptidoglycan hydrolase-like protein with peptidoglycan-binding domain
MFAIPVFCVKLVLKGGEILKKKITACIVVLSFVFALLSQGVSAHTALRYGIRGSEVQKMQQRLIDLKILSGRADGRFGPATRSAVIRFQKLKGLKQDGIAGPATLGALYGTTPGSSSSNSGGSSGTTAVNRTLRYGSRGSDVKSLQQRLNQLGFKCGTPDGRFGPKTRTAVYSFQRSKGLKVTGIADSTTLSAIYGTTPGSGSNSGGSSGTAAINRTLKYGSRGADVKLLQQRLNQLGFNCGTPDGSFGPRTRSAVYAFQRANGLSVNGIVDSANISKLFPPPPPPPPPPNPPETEAPLVEFHGTPGELAGKTVFLDAGHGGGSPGACREDVYEKVLNIDMVMRLKRMLEEAGAKVLLTREGDTERSLFYRDSFVNKYLLNLEIQKLTSERNEAQVQLDAASAVVGERNDKIAEQFLIMEQLKKDFAVENIDMEYIQSQTVILDNRITELQGQIESLKQQLDIPGADIENLQTQIGSKEEELSKKQSTRTLCDSAIKLDADIKKVDPAPFEQQITDLTTLIAEKGSAITDWERITGLFQEVLDKPAEKERFGIYALQTGPIPGKNYPTPDLVKTLDLVREKYQDDIIFISIHCNSTGDTVGTSSGTKVYTEEVCTEENSEYYNNQNYPQRKVFAEKLLEQMNASTNFSQKASQISYSDFNVLRETSVVSALIEVAYINNPGDRALLKKDQTREDACKGMYNGVAEYFKVY